MLNLPTRLSVCVSISTKILIRAAATLVKILADTHRHWFDGQNFGRYTHTGAGLIKILAYGAQTLPRHILCCELLQSWNFQMAITQSFLKWKFMIKSVDIENCLASSKMQKYFQKKFGKIFLKIFENRRFLIIEKRYF